MAGDDSGVWVGFGAVGEGHGVASMSQSPGVVACIYFQRVVWLGLAEGEISDKWLVAAMDLRVCWGLQI